jgi:BarA-like signal transduction histidine kinase
VNRRSTQISYKKRLSAEHLVPDFVEITSIVILSIDLQAAAEAESLKEELEVARKVKAAADESLALLLVEKQQLQEAHDSNLKVKGEISSKMTGR